MNEKNEKLAYDKATHKKVVWFCDKNECQSLNLRIIPIKQIINDDICTHCLRNIHEPLTFNKK